jgi:hypothetical protein
MGVTLKLALKRLLLIAAVVVLAAYPASRFGVFRASGDHLNP